VFERDHYVALDAAGALMRLQRDGGGFDTRKLMHFHTGAIVGLATARDCHLAATAGADGSVRVWDYVATRQVGENV
jgi:hypothetical protein